MLTSLLIAYSIHQFVVPQSRPVLHRFYNPRTQVVGSLAVTADTVGTQSIPRGATRVEMVKLVFTASCRGDVPVHAVTIHRRGLGFNADISRIYAVSRGARLTRAQTISRKDGFVDLRFRRFVVPACRTREVSVLVDFASDASIAGEHRFEVEGAGAIDAGTARVTLARSIVRPPQRTTGRTVGTITVTKLNLTGRVKYGAGRIIGRFRIQADRGDHHRITAITFTNDGSAKGDALQNIFIEAGYGRRLSTIALQLDGDRVRLVLDPPLLLRKNQRKRISVRADVRSGVGRTIRLEVEEPGDVEAEVVRGR